VQIAYSFGAHVTGVCSTRNAHMVRSIGTDRIIDYTKEDFTQAEQAYDVMLDLSRDPVVIGLQARADLAGSLRHGRRQGHGSLVWAWSSDLGSLGIAVRTPADARVRREA
jgi:NADPH:quinone reductase-like Zn-dependent oxidoreductase